MASSHALRKLIFGTSPKISFPSHVQAAINRQQNDSEKLISWVLLAIVVIFSVLYIVSPKTFSPTVKFAPVPWALSAYFIFSLIRLYAAYRGYLVNWFLLLSIIVDIMLLMTLIWSFHVQYEQPPSFYLKAPTLQYLFIFIALRTLRFQAKYVLTIGMVAAVGWFALILFAVFFSPHGTVTRDYVLYLTSNHILIGGEIDKIISILMVTAILTIAVLRGQHLLSQAVAETMATTELSKFFVPEIASTIIESGANLKPGYGESRDVTILHCDIRGFTKTSKLCSPAEVMSMLTEYQARVVKIIRKHQGSVDKFLGDGILTSFNALPKTPAHAAKALSAAGDILTTIQEWNEQRDKEGKQPVKIGISITTGSVVLGIVGDATRMEYTVIGDPVNLAAKLDKHCRVEKCSILATKETLDLAIAQGYVQPPTIEILLQRTVEGVAEPVDLAILAR
ncbi:adenylate/guanylate cyclase domain-containing protein [Legionella spiritensis]|uniref:Adenylate cyclase n=1 Tax=Legionella spiritensis TaxID=452 RepID=A0A0W0YZL4_LEGSP|nr:adenylate/guanylate cyclase domain-containing protein [Legionella spiritensis]KTD61958.1 adenylate cyclase [Legionella spiritensis]SNV30912.1 adenylate cyclase [Legionella spiritensis]